MRIILLLLCVCFLACDDDPKSKPTKPTDTVVVVEPDTAIDGLYWPDRRPIGMIMLASYSDPYERGKRNWKLGGVAQFSKEALFAHAYESIQNMKDLNAQGMVTWDIEGQEYPHAFTYLGDPRDVPQEMQPYIDEYFAKFDSAGFRTGVCIRPDSLVYTNGWVYHYTVADPFQNIYDKILYARSRWGCSLFYVDSNVGEGLVKPVDPVTYKIKEIDNTAGYGQMLSYKIFKELNERFPDCLIMPEHQDNAYFRYTAPYNDKNFRSYLTPDEKGFQVLAVGDSFSQEELNFSVKQGNVLMSRVWYKAPEHDKIKQAYEANR